MAATGVAPSAPRRLGRWWAVPLEAAAAGVLWLVVGREGPLARLGRVLEAPVFAGVAVRGDADSASRLADSGMTAYGAGRYREAVQLLGAVAPEDRTPALSFYLGLATLMSGDPAEAVHVLHDVPAGSPYAAEAHFYSAKAWLQSGRGDSALAHLAAVPAEARIAARAAALADSVREVLR
jgi:tetratricopeptide (TPR) repeat protein